MSKEIIEIAKTLDKSLSYDHATRRPASKIYVGGTDAENSIIYLVNRETGVNYTAVITKSE